MSVSEAADGAEDFDFPRRWPQTGAHGTISIVIPTYNRERVLVETIERLLCLTPLPDEILVVDQSRSHLVETEIALAEFAADRTVRRIWLPSPSIPRAMNRGLLEARGRIVLFVDDDIVPERSLIASHLRAHASERDELIAGRVIQPWQEGVDFSRETEFHFASLRPREIDHFMGGNFSLDRNAALLLGGFDENFVRVAYGFEKEFAFRWRKSGRRIRFEPAAVIHHLKASAGGTRSYGEHLTTMKPDHSVGAYYGILRSWSGARSAVAFLSRPLRAVTTRSHLRRPWRIPITLIGELGGIAWALWLAARGPRYIDGLEERGRGDV